MEVRKDSPLNETTGVGEPKPTSGIRATRRPDDREAIGSKPLQSQLQAGVLLCILRGVVEENLSRIAIKERLEAASMQRGVADLT